MSEKFPLLSEELLSHADFLQCDMLGDRTSEERADYAKSETFVESVMTLLVVTREKLHPVDLSGLSELVRGNRELIENILDDRYSREALKQVKNRISRTLRLAEMRSIHAPSEQTNRYIQEAARSYIYGLTLSSVVMARAALEQALKDRLGLQNSGEYHELKTLIGEATKWNLLTPASERAARNLAKRSNDVIHEHPTKDEDSAFEILCGIRSLLEEIYSAEGTY